MKFFGLSEVRPRTKIALGATMREPLLKLHPTHLCRFRHQVIEQMNRVRSRNKSVFCGTRRSFPAKGPSPLTSEVFRKVSVPGSAVLLRMETPSAC
jgi:hypothetical protein